MQRYSKIEFIFKICGPNHVAIAIKIKINHYNIYLCFPYIFYKLIFGIFDFRPLTDYQYSVLGLECIYIGYFALARNFSFLFKRSCQ